MTPISLEHCLAGMVVKIVKGQETFEGTVVEIRKPNRYVLVVDVPTYWKDGTIRYKWKRKNVEFTNGRVDLIEYDEDAWNPAVARAKAARKAYANSRQQIKLTATTRADHYENLGLTRQSTLDEFNKVRRLKAPLYHPDVVQHKYDSMVKGGNQAEADQLRKDSQEFFASCAVVEQDIKRALKEQKRREQQ